MKNIIYKNNRYEIETEIGTMVSNDPKFTDFYFVNENGEEIDIFNDKKAA